MILVRLVTEQGITLSEAGRKMHINPSTVRLIIKKYKETGTYFMKRLRNTPKNMETKAPSFKNKEKDVKIEVRERDVNESEAKGTPIKEETI